MHRNNCCVSNRLTCRAYTNILWAEHIVTIVCFSIARVSRETGKNLVMWKDG